MVFTSTLRDGGQIKDVVSLCTRPAEAEESLTCHTAKRYYDVCQQSDMPSYGVRVSDPSVTCEPAYADVEISYQRLGSPMQYHLSLSTRYF